MDVLGLTRAFSDYEFTESTHQYTYKGEPVETSVTTLLGALTEPFDEAKWLPIKARQLEVSTAELKAKWRRKADISTSKGTAVHRYMENLFNGKKQEEFFPEAQQLDVLDDVVEAYGQIVPLCEKFFKDSKGKLIPIKTEFTVGLGTKIAGQIDLLAWNETAQELQIIDYKTNKEIKTSGGFANFLPPVEHLNDNELVHYSLQLGIYKEILARHGFAVGGMYLIHLNEKNATYRGYKCLDLLVDVQKILNWYEIGQEANI